MIVLVQSRKTKRDKFFVCLWRNNNSYNYWSDSVLDAAVRPEAVLEHVVQTELNLSTVEASNEEEQEPVCVDDVHKLKQAVGCDVRRPSPSDVKKTKSMRVLCGVPALSSGKK